ncbi:uncharacterized protein LOC126982672 isoform X2 [Eriocheir sinensis]|uniref:uncharacterized protein LOC126982672 isoform X2 n=1 Tax=Eriocheir sinensis TaxID=95602 RepID=UPI0021CA3D31|nr:uncharacterized protein LOC126982672 isoform X2 [Eriocheir sinensis]
MSKPPGPSGSPQELDQVLFSSLLILGLDIAALEHKFKAPVILKSFSRIDKRLGDEILHFLFVCLDREKAAKIFRDCWPLLDKKHEAQFHKATFEWYKSLQQSYRQPVPTVMAKTFMSPGGPKFTSTLMTLTRMALHASIAKRAPSCTLLNMPSHSRSPQQNLQTFRTIQAFKVKHSQNYITKQEVRQSTLLNMKNKARELSGQYRRLCKEGEKAAVEMSSALSNDERLTQNQRDVYASASLATVQKAVLTDITQMNNEMKKLWSPVDRFQQVEGSAWEVLRPLLDGSAFLSHIDGSVYSPQVPEMVYKTHASTVNKLKLEGLYRDGKLDLLSLVQYSNLALTVLLDSLRSTHSLTQTVSSEKLQAQSGQVTSVGETVNQLSDKLMSLLPTLSHSASASYPRSMADFPSSERLALEKSHLCPPTPPFTLSSQPVHSLRTAHVPLQLTPGVQQSSQSLAGDGFSVTPRRLLCGMGMIRASKKSPKPDVTCSSVTCKDDFTNTGEGAKDSIPEGGLSIEMLTVDVRGKYLRKKEEALRVEDHRPHQTHRGLGRSLPKDVTNKRRGKPAKALLSKVPIKSSSKPAQPRVKKVNGAEEKKDNLKYNVGPEECVEDLLIDELANDIAQEINECENDSGTTESHNTQTLNETPWKTTILLDSGCAEMSKDSDTLLEAISDMNIVKKSERSYGSQDSTPHKDFHMQNGKYAIQSQNRSVKTSTLLEEMLTRLNTPVLGRPGHQVGVFRGTAGEASLVDNQNSPLMSQERNGSLGERDGRWKDSIPGLQRKLHFVTQTPPTTNTRSPLGLRIPDKFDGVDTSPGSNLFSSRLPAESFYKENNTITELRNHSKARLDFLLELQQSSEKGDSMSQKENAKGTKSKPNFLSYVEKLKSSQPSLAPESDNIKTEEIKCHKTSVTTSYESTTTDLSVGDWLSKDVSKEYYSNFARMQNLLCLDEDATLIDTNTQEFQDSPERDEVFVSAKYMSHKFEAQTQSVSSLLPETSVFDTLTDSILGGELDVSLLANKNVGEQIRRESVSSRRQSISNMRRLSLESNKQLFESPMFEPDDFVCIHDESDSCLLSTSSEM